MYFNIGGWDQERIDGQEFSVMHQQATHERYSMDGCTLQRAAISCKTRSHRSHQQLILDVLHLPLPMSFQTITLVFSLLRLPVPTMLVVPLFHLLPMHSLCQQMAKEVAMLLLPLQLLQQQ
jgi:hypothetical protein